MMLCAVEFSVVYGLQKTLSMFSCMVDARCLDEVVIVLPSQTLEQQEQHRWRLCREVEETEIIVCTISMWI